MRTFKALIPLALFTQACTKEVVADTNDAMDNLVGKLADNLMHRGFQMWPERRGGLDVTALGKPSSLQMPHTITGSGAQAVARSPMQSIGAGVARGSLQTTQATSDKIAVIGAGGATGLECVRRLQSQGTSVRCVVRSPDKYAGKFGDAEVVEGDVTNYASIREALKDTSGVIFAASASDFSGPAGPFEVDYLGVGKAAKAAKANNASKFVLITSRLVDPRNRFDPIRVLLNTVKWGNMDAKWEGEEVLRSSGLEYSIVRPGGLAGGEGKNTRPTDKKPGTEHLIVGAAEQDLGETRSIHRADVAAVVCEALTCSDAASKTIEIVARPPEGGEPTIPQQLASVFDAIPKDKPPPMQPA